MKLFLALILATLVSPTFASASDETFEVKGSAIAPDAYQAKEKAGKAATAEATRRCQARGQGEARMIGDAYAVKGCDESYSVHGQSETCIFTFVCTRNNAEACDEIVMPSVALNYTPSR